MLPLILVGGGVVVYLNRRFDWVVQLVRWGWSMHMPQTTTTISLDLDLDRGFEEYRIHMAIGRM